MSSTDDHLYAAHLLSESRDQLSESVDPSRMTYENHVGKVKEVIAHVILWEVEDVSALMTFSRASGYQSDSSADVKLAGEMHDVRTQRLYSAWEGRDNCAAHV